MVRNRPDSITSIRAVKRSDFRKGSMHSGYLDRAAGIPAFANTGKLDRAHGRTHDILRFPGEEGGST